jgi:xylulose-5-phosphate/fructose-6-phosphate phosphoketolase
MIILRSPKGWTGPKDVDGKQTEGTYRSHQVPMGEMSHPGHVKILEEWLESYRPRELFDETGRLRPELAELAPRGPRRMGANPHANGGLLLRDLRLPDFRGYAVTIPEPGSVSAEATRIQGEMIRDVVEFNPETFRVFSPDETASNRWGAVFEVTNRCSTAEIIPGDDHVAPDGRVIEVLSEHQCEGWLEGYLLRSASLWCVRYKAYSSLG